MSQISTQSNASSRASPEPPSQVYLAQLHDHFADSRLHSLGSRNDDDSLLPSVFPPNAHWTSKEKDLFFHALAIHSRLRPDLIARDVKTKTLVDVCVYLDMLEEGLENLDDIKAQERSNQSKRKVKEFIRDELPIAMEMSEQWCHFEARQASLIAASEEKLHEIWLVQSHEAEVEAKRRELRAPKGGARDEQNKRDRRGEKMRGKEVQSWLKERKVEWEVEERLERLGADDLRALDMILRGTEVPTRVDDGDVDEGGDEGGGATNPANAQRLEQEGHLTQNKAQATLFSPCGPPGPSNVPPVGVPVLPNYLQLELGPRAPQDFLASNIPPVPTSFDESLIDPTLRGSSVHTLAPRPQTLVLANDTRDLHPDSNLLSHATFSHSQLLISGQPPSIIKPVLAPPAASITHPPVTRAQSWTRSSGFVADDTTADDAPSEEQALSLSPKSRRRLQKRMYMRRKRAQLTGRGVDTDPRKLKPGRKSYQASDDKQRVDPTMDEDGEHIDIDMTMESTVPNLDPATSVANVEAHTSRERLPSDETRKIGRHPHPSGLTRPYKARVELESIGMSTEVMKNEGLDLLRFSAFHRLTRSVVFITLSRSYADSKSTCAECTKHSSTHQTKWIPKFPSCY